MEATMPVALISLNGHGILNSWPILIKFVLKFMDGKALCFDA